MVRFHQFVKACFLLFLFVLGLLLRGDVVELLVLVYLALALALALALGLGLGLVLLRGDVVELLVLLVEPVVLKFEVLGVAVTRLGVVVSVQLKLL